MGITMTRTFGHMMNTNRRKFSELTTRLTQDMGQAIQVGVEAAQQVVDTSGTTKSGKAGRIVTGDMRKELASKTTKASNTMVEGEYGWLEETPFYWLYQEYGFKHYLSGELIVGMFALRESSEVAWAEFNRLADISIGVVFGR